MRRLPFPAVIAVLGIATACTTTPKMVPESRTSQTDCRSEIVRSVQSAAELRELASRCADHVETYAEAISKLNELGPPPIKRLELRPAVELARTERATLEVDVFFNFLEAYPHDLAFPKLAELLSRMETGFAIERVEVIGRSDPNELQLASFQVERRRTAFLRKYFLAAGVPPQNFHSSERGPKQSDTLEGRARDRVAEIRVVMLRERANPRQKGAP